MERHGRALLALSCALASLLGAGASAFAFPWPSAAERRVSFDTGWRFQKGEAAGAERQDFDDAGWRRLDLPHDWAIEGPFDPAISPHQGSLPFFGVAWYRKRFSVPESARGRYYTLEIDGAMSNSTVFLNGHELGGRPYGYIGFALDLTPHLRFGGENVVTVRLAPEPESSRWYPGAGLYRHVWIDATGPVHVEHWGTYVTTPGASEASWTPGDTRWRAARRSRPSLPTGWGRPSRASPSSSPSAGTSSGPTSTPP
jgi:beta-galactosidase